MIVGHHITFAAYGFWLPNDPRGSWSTCVGSDALYIIAGSATTTTARHSLAYNSHDPQQRRAAKEALSRKAVRFNGMQARAIARGFGNYVAKSNCSIWACAIMPEHVHLVVAQTQMHLDQLVIQLKGAAIRQLIEERCHPFADRPDARGRLPKVFVRGYWSVYLDEENVERKIRYVEQNPVRDGLRAQNWKFVTKYSAPTRSAARHG